MSYERESCLGVRLFGLAQSSKLIAHGRQRTDDSPMGLRSAVSFCP
jgi:hypothetical protein